MKEQHLLESVIVLTKANELLLIKPDCSSETLIKANSGVSPEWLHFLAASPVLYGQLLGCHNFLEALKPLCNTALQAQIEIVQNAAQQAMRLALAQTVETDKRLN